MIPTCQLKTSTLRDRVLLQMRRLSAWQLALMTIICAGGCGGADSPDPAMPATPGEAILECVRSSGEKLDAAFAANDVHAVARDIVQLLDDYEDSPEAARFEEFHRAMEELEALAAREPGADELKGKIEAIKALAANL